MQHRLKFLSLLFVLLLVLLVGTARGASADVASPFGVNVHVPQGAEMNAAFDRLKAAGIGWVRIDFIWAWAEPAT